MQPSRHMQPCWVLLLVIACCAAPASPASAASIHQAGKKNDALAMGHTVSPQPQLQHPPLPMRSSGGSGKGGTDSSSKRSKGSGAVGSGNRGGSSPASQAPLRARLQAIPAQQVSSLSLPRTQIGLITVIGERHSGTNFMWRLLRSNLADSVNVTDTFCDYKHRYQLPGKQCPDLHKTLVVVMFRNPYDWALAMHERCWCGGDDVTNTTRSLGLDAFLSMPWHDTTRRKSEVTAGPTGWVAGLTPGMPNATELLDTGLLQCTNLLQCRARKYTNFLNISRWAPHVVYVRHEDVITPAQSLDWLSAVLKRYSLPQVNNTLQPIDLYKRRKALKFSADAAKVKSLWFNPRLVSGLPELQHFASHVSRAADAAVEAKVGYPLQRQWLRR